MNDDLNDGGQGSEPADGSPDAGDSPSEPVDLDAIASEIDGEMLEAAGGDPAPPPAAPGPNATDDELQRFIDTNYGGDRNAFLQAQYASRHETSRLLERIEALESGRTSAPAAPARDPSVDFKELRQADPDVQFVESQISAIDARVRAIDTKVTGIRAEYTTLDADIQRLNNELINTDDESLRSRHRHEIVRKEARMASLNNEYTTLELAKEQRLSDKMQRERDLARAEAGIRQQMAQDEQRQRDEVAAVNSVHSEYQTAFEAEIEAFDIDPKSKTASYVFHATKTLLSDWLIKQGKNVPSLDTAGMRRCVRQLLNEAETAGAIRRRNVSGNAGVRRPAPGRTAAAVPVRPGAPRPAAQPQSRSQHSTSAPGRRPGPAAGTPAKPRSADDLLDDPQAVRDRANKIFEAVARQSGGRSGQGLA